MKTLISAVCVLILAAPAWADRAEDAARYTEQLKKSKDPKIRQTAIEELGKLSQVRKSYGKDALPFIIEACKDKNVRVRAAAAEAIGKSYSGDDDSMVVTLLAGIVKNDAEMQVKFAAARGLAAMGPRAKAAIPTMREVMNKEPMQSRLRNVLRQSMRQINVQNN